jgi:hypothetical protein
MVNYSPLQEVDLADSKFRREIRNPFINLLGETKRKLPIIFNQVLNCKMVGQLKTFLFIRGTTKVGLMKPMQLKSSLTLIFLLRIKEGDLQE